MTETPKSHSLLSPQAPLSSLNQLGTQDFKAKGLPYKNYESWKHSPLKRIKSHYRWEGEQSNGDSPISSPSLPPSLSLLPQRVVFFNGKLCRNLTSLESGCQWVSLTEDQLRKQVTPILAQQDCFLGLALAHHRKAFQLTVEKTPKNPIGLYHIFDKNFDAMMTHALLSMETLKGVQCEVLELTLAPEDFPSSSLSNSHCFVKVEQSSELEHLRVFQTQGGATSLSHVIGGVKGSGCYRNTTLALGGNFLRNHLQVTLLEEGAETSLNALYSHRGQEDSSHSSLIQHHAPRTHSSQLYKGFLDEHSHSSFHGTIAVKKHCQEITSTQLNKNILLSPTARVDSNPQMEINNCDVKCNHGSTTGQLNPEEFFYLRSRGLPLKQAKKLLSRAFCEEVVLGIKSPSLRKLASGYLREYREF